MSDLNGKSTSSFRKFIDSKWVVWGIVFLALVLVSITATIAFGFGTLFHKELPLPRLVQSAQPSTLEVVNTSTSSGTASQNPQPGTATADLLQSPATATKPQSAETAGLSASSVTLQAGLVAGTDALGTNLGL